MKDIINNKWVKFGVSFLSILYAYIIIKLAYSCVLYDFVIEKKVSFFLLYTLMNLAFLAVMFYSRKQVITSIISMILIPFVFVITVMNLWNLILIIPPFFVTVFMFFACKSGGNLKTILGTIYLLIYILGIVAFLLIKSMFYGSNETVLDSNLSKTSEMWQYYSPSVIDEATQNSISPTGEFRYYIVDISDSSLGRIEIHVEPNNMDEEHSIYTLKERGREKTVGIVNKRGDENIPEVSWSNGNTIQYQFKGQDVKKTIVTVEDKNYFAFMYD